VLIANTYLGIGPFSALPSLPKSREEKLPFAGSVAKDGEDLIITGFVRAIEERKLLVSLKKLSSSAREKAVRALRGRQTEIVLRVTDALEFRICGQAKSTILGIGQIVKATVRRASIPGFGVTFLLNDLQIVPRSRSSFGQRFECRKVASPAKNLRS
jgi:hypothetical protein